MKRIRVKRSASSGRLAKEEEKLSRRKLTPEFERVNGIVMRKDRAENYVVMDKENRIIARSRKDSKDEVL